MTRSGGSSCFCFSAAVVLDSHWRFEWRCGSCHLHNLLWPSNLTCQSSFGLDSSYSPRGKSVSCSHRLSKMDPQNNGISSGHHLTLSCWYGIFLLMSFQSVHFPLSSGSLISFLSSSKCFLLSCNLIGNVWAFLQRLGLMTLGLLLWAEGGGPFWPWG